MQCRKNILNVTDCQFPVTIRYFSVSTIDLHRDE